MPELPDLQVFSRNLSRRLVGKSVEKTHAVYAKKFNVSPTELDRAITGNKLISVLRDGKELHLMFADGNVLGIHLMLRGQLQYFEESNDNKYTILGIWFSGGVGLAIADVMKQAVVTLNPKKSKAPDALSPEVSYEFLKNKLGASRSTVKKVITDQNVIRGIGNAYADEILWHARISPFSISNKLPDSAIRTLSKSIRTVLGEAEKQILKAYPDIIGGEVRDFVAVHSPDKTKSPTGAEIIKQETGGRSTYYTKEQQLWE